MMFIIQSVWSGLWAGIFADEDGSPPPPATITVIAYGDAGYGPAVYGADQKQ